MLKTKLTRPTIVTMMGLPGSGKSYTANHLADMLGLALISDNKVRYSLIKKPKYDKEENLVVLHMMLMMAEEYLGLGIPVMFDTGLNRLPLRKHIRELARKFKADTVLIWIQIDKETARLRTKITAKSVDGVTSSVSRLTDEVFNNLVKSFQPPENEDYIVISGKYTFESQKPIIIRKLREQGLVSDDTLKGHVPMPEMMNLAARAQMHSNRADYTRRNISIG